MPIEALPQTTINTIGSTQCLTDPNSVVKELVDNAIDANATVIVIEVSSNTLDKIQVKDNGYGIAPGDRSLVCKRYCTSKIRTLDDLHCIGGSSFGFRGEALASAVDLSHQVIVTTRVDGEATAVEITFNAKDHQVGERRVSQPVGTTVSIADFLKKMPVRRQAALKERTTAAQLTKIKRNLQAYCLAKPHLRASFKVLKAKNDKNNWVYAPKHPRSTPRSIAFPDAAMKIFGSKIADSYQLSTWIVPKSSTSSREGSPGNLDAEPDQNIDFVFQAYLPWTDFNEDLTNVSSPKQFVSIDGRPVSSTRGTVKQIVSKFKKAYKKGRSSDGIKIVNDPLLCLNIACVPGSYDANIEPAKDDVLFEQPDKILEAAEAFFRNVYGAPTQAGSNEQTTSKAGTKNFELLLSGHKSNLPHSPQPRAKSDPQLANIIVASNHPHQLHASMDNSTTSNRLREKVLATHRQNRSMPTHEDARADVLESTAFEDDQKSPRISSETGTQEINTRKIPLSNPWAVARLNAAIRQSTGRIIGHEPTPPQPNGVIQLQSPQPAASDNTSSPLGMEMPLRPSAGSSPKSDEGHRQSPSFFPFPEQRRSQSSIKQPRTQRIPDKEHAVPARSPMVNWLQHDVDTDFGSAKAPAAGTRLDQIPSTTHRPRPQPHNRRSNLDTLKKPFVPPSQDLRDVAFFPPSPLPPSIRKSPDRRQQSKNTTVLNIREHPDSTSGDSRHPDLDETLAYEESKRKALQKYREQKQERQKLLYQALPSRHNAQRPLQDTGMPSPPSSSPHHNRYIAAKAALQSPQLRNQGSPALAPSDPRTLLINAAKVHTSDLSSPIAKNLPRNKLVNLPFETTQVADEIHELQLVLCTSVKQISRKVEQGFEIDAYITNGQEFDGFANPSEDAIVHWESRMKQLMARHLPRTVGSGNEDFDLDLTFTLQQTQETVGTD